MRPIDADALFAEIKDRHDMFADCEYIGDKARRDELGSFMADIVNAPTIGGWISVEDRLPEATKPDANGNITFSDYVLTYQTYEDGHRWIAEDTCRVDHGCWMHEVPGMGCRVTHWMPLPSTEGLDET